jgi:uncharacterized surface protein with fasciclin (FAS1) repeats
MSPYKRHYMTQAIATAQNIFTTVLAGVRADTRLRWGLGAGASVLLSASILGMGGSFAPNFLHASDAPSVVPLSHLAGAQSLAIVDMSTTTVADIIQNLSKAERFDLMLYNSGADESLKKDGITAFVPASPEFDYLPKGYIAGLTRVQMKNLALSHLVARSLPVEETLNGNVVTMGNTAVDFNVDATVGTVTIGGAKVLKVYKAKNGYVYLINKVLMPKSE